MHEKIACQKGRVIDGDTIIAHCQREDWRIRLLGIDAPEMKQAPWGEMAKEALENHLKREFIIETVGIDKYQRILGRIWQQKEDVNLWMVHQGMAVAYQNESTPKHYFATEAKAKRAKKGIWSEAGSQQDPKKWRRYHQ